MTSFAFNRVRVITLAVCLLLSLSYFIGVPKNPPGFFVDESSIAFNANSIAQHGADEHGLRLPLFFRAFGEYKSPVYVYILAAIYKLAGPSIGAARLLSALFGLTAAIVFGLLAAETFTARNEQGNGRFIAGAIVFSTALLLPWLFEISRLVFEVALTPLAMGLLLLAIERARRNGWEWRHSIAIALALTLLTYSYSVGRVLGPLLTFGLIVFVGSVGWWKTFVRTSLLYLIGLVPLFVFTRLHPGALGTRFSYVTYITPTMTWGEIARRFLSNYAGSFSPWLWFVAGDPEPRHHVQTMGSLLVAPVLLALLGSILIITKSALRKNRWWWFVIFGLLIAPLPSALTVDHFHTLRLVALPIFLLTLTVPAIAWLLDRRSRVKQILLLTLVVATLVQGIVFQRQFHKESPRRWHNFDTFYPEIFRTAVAMPQRPIYLIDNVGAPGYMHAYWYATLSGMDLNQFLVLPKDRTAPSGSLVISTELPCDNCELILQRAGFRVYVQK